MNELEEVAASLHRAALRMLRRLRQHDSAMGLSTSQASALSLIVFGPPRTLSELALMEQVRPPTMTRLVDRLEGSGLATRERSTGDRRRIVVSATAAGRRTLEEGRRRRVEALARDLRRLTTSERHTLARATAILERIEEEAEQDRKRSNACRRGQHQR